MGPFYHNVFVAVVIVTVIVTLSTSMTYSTWAWGQSILTFTVIAIINVIVIAFVVVHQRPFLRGALLPHGLHQH